MLRYKPRQRVGTQVSRWNTPMNQLKNRGSMRIGQGNVITIKDFQLNGYAAELGSANGIRLSTSGVGGTSASVWWAQEFRLPLTMVAETYISGAADGILLAIMRGDGALTALGGSGGNAGLPGGYYAPISVITQDQWNNSQPVPYIGFGDSRLGSGTQYPVYYINNTVNDSAWNTFKIEWDSNLVTVWKNNVPMLSANWKEKTGYELPTVGESVEYVHVGVMAATGAATQNAYIRKLSIDDQILYEAPA